MAETHIGILIEDKDAFDIAHGHPAPFEPVRLVFLPGRRVSGGGEGRHPGQAMTYLGARACHFDGELAVVGVVDLHGARLRRVDRLGPEVVFGVLSREPTAVRQCARGRGRGHAQRME